jgi:hypothetical protein
MSHLINIRVRLLLAWVSASARDLDHVRDDPRYAALLRRVNLA